MRKFLRTIFRSVSIVVLLGVGLLTAWQSNLLYFPRAYQPQELSSWMQKGRGQRVTYETGQGAQVAYLQRRVRQEGPPDRLWIVGAGNGSVALDLADFCWDHGDSRDVFLLVDYPGYGECAGSPTPGHIQENMAAVVPAAARALGLTLEQVRPKLRVFGHSLGCAAVLLGAREFGVHRGVLLAPFTSTMDMAQVVLHLPLGSVVWHRFNNVARLTELATGEGKMILFHGTEDEVIPLRMAHEIQAAAPTLVELHEVPGGRHNDLLFRQPEEITAALARAR